MIRRLSLIAAALATQAGAQSTAPAAGGPAQGASTYVDIEGGIGYSTNPYLSLGTPSGKPQVRASVKAVHSRRTARTSTLLSAYAETGIYLGRHGSQKLFSLNVHHDAAVSERLRLFGDLIGSLDQSGELGTRFISVGPIIDPSATGVPLPTLTDTETGFIIPSARIYHLGSQAGAQLALSATDSLTGRVGFDRTVLSGTVLHNSYNAYLASLAYNRRIDARFSLGGKLTAQSTSYSNSVNSRVIIPQIVGYFKLSDNTNLSGAIGVGFAATKIDGLSQHSAGIALNGSLCHLGEKTQLCAVISRVQQAQTGGGPATVLSGGVTFFKKIDAIQTLQFSANANRNKQSLNSPFSIASQERSSYLSGSMAYTRRLGARLYSGASLSLRKFFQAGPAPKADLNASVFLRLRLGDR